MNQEETLQISVTFPQGAYSGSELGAAEDLPSPARLHEALLAAAAGGPWGVPDGRVLVAHEEHRAALAWLERHEPLGAIPPQVTLSAPSALRYRWRASPVERRDSDFEPRAALDGPVRYLWPAAPGSVLAALREIAREVTHVGRADSVAIIDVTSVARTSVAGRLHPLVPRRGPGRVLRVPCEGRTDALTRAHREASQRGGHSPGPMGRQASDVLVTGANEEATALRRFAPPQADADWPYAEVWTLRVGTGDARMPLTPALRVPAAVGVHRAIVDAIGEDVPPFVTGRDGDGPLRGAGHLSIQLAQDDRSGDVLVLLGLPPDVRDADRATLRAALERPLRAGARRRGHATRWFTTERPRVRPALPFWTDSGALMRTDVPLVLDAPGRPRHAPWSLEDAVLCSVGYAMRGVLERAGTAWGAGWAFRRELVALLREEWDVAAVVRRAPGAASRFAHRVPDGELTVAVNAVVRLGRLGPMTGGFLALGRTRHLGGGLLVPFGEAPR